MEPTQITPPSVLAVKDTIFTPDGLAIKHTDAVEIINVRLENRTDFTFHSWQACRFVRRDFNFVAGKMFHRELRKGGREQIVSLLHEVRLQAEMLVIACNGFDAPTLEAGRIVPVRLVSAAAANLLRAFITADSAYAKLNHAVEARKLQANLIHGYTHPFEDAFSDLKMYCSTRNQQQKSAQELAQAHGIA